MKVCADVTQLTSDGMWMNIEQRDYAFGVWASFFQHRLILYINQKDQSMWFMQFKNEEAVLNFEKIHPFLSRIFDSKVNIRADLTLDEKKIEDVSHIAHMRDYDDDIEPKLEFYKGEDDDN